MMKLSSRLLAGAFVLELLEPRRLLAVHFSIDATQDVHAISRFIYGTNQPLAGAYADGTFERLGGNRMTAYNWENNASNAGSDYQFQNDDFLGGGSTPGGAVIPTITDAAAHNAGALITVPINGYVSADTNGGGDVRNSGSNYLSTRFKQEVAAKGSAFTLTPSTTDANVYQDEFVNWVKTKYPYGSTDANKPIWFELDNEPDLWSSTHAEVHPAATTYAEMVAKTTAYASAIKNVDPTALVYGPANYGWEGYINLQNAPDANGRDFQSYYLAQMSAASTAAGKRLLDALDVHWYPEATDANGTRITSPDASASLVAARLQAPRSLWDSTYTESSWITKYSTNGPINLIPRLNAKIAANFPGTKLSISEYNYGGGGDISGGIAQADVLGIYGRQNVFSANEWKLNSDESFIGGGFQMFRNYDGAHSAFGDTSVRATTDDAATSSVYASVNSTDPSVMTIVAINKSAMAQAANLNLGSASVSGAAKVYQLTSASATPQSAGMLTIANAQNFNYTMPGYSVTTIRVPLNAAPTTKATSFNYQSNPNTLGFTFSADVSASLSASDVSVTNLGTGASVPVSYAGYDSASNTVTFNLPTLADGNYRATLAGAGVSDASGTTLSASATIDFFSLVGDVNHDRKVDISDLSILASNFQQSGRTFAQGDLDHNGTVDISDLTILAGHFQDSMAAPTTSLHADRSLVRDILE